MTREEIIEQLKLTIGLIKQDGKDWLDDRDIPMLEECVKALEQEPCDDVVSRQAVLASIKNLYPDMPVMDIFGARRKWLDKYAPYFECENAVEQLPSVRPQEQTGHWIDFDYPWFRCSECGAVRDNKSFLENYCPNCGTRMVEQQERSDKE